MSNMPASPLASRLSQPARTALIVIGGAALMTLAAKVQILRNRGYALSGDEDDLKSRLQALERDVQDPAVGAREEELWSRLIVLREYSERLNKEMEKPAGAESEGLDEETQAKAKRVSC